MNHYGLFIKLMKRRISDNLLLLLESWFAIGMTCVKWHTGLLYKLSKSMPYWFTRLVGLLLRDRRFRVHMGNDISAWRPQRNGLPQGSVLASVLFNLYSNDLPVTRGRKFIYADDICLAIQGQFFCELECSLSSDVARMSHFCRQWRLKPSASKTISSVFHLHNTSATRELSVYLDGQRLRHECHPTYLGVTLDRMLSYREHLAKTAGKLKNRNSNLLMKLAGSTWGASANTLRSCALALCYSAAEYCAPVWTRPAHTSRVDVQLNSTMRLISGTLRSTPLTWLPVLSNIEPPALWRKAATDKMVEKIVKHDSWPIQPDILSPPLLRLTSRKPLWLDLQPVDIKSRWRHNYWKSAQLVNSHPVCDPQSGNRVSTSLGNSGLCWTVFARNRDTAVPAEGNGDLKTLICVLVATPRRCLALLNPVPWQNWMAAYLGYTLQMKMLFRGWRVMAHETHTRRRRRSGTRCGLGGFV